MSLETWLAFLAVEILMSLAPGAAVLFVVSQAAWRGTRAGVAAAGGVGAANLVYYLLSALGLAAVVSASHMVFLVLKWVGAAYLVWLGANAIISSLKSQVDPDAQAEAAISAHKGLRDGMVVQLANPKALLFFIAFVPQFIDPTRPLAIQFVILGATTLVVETIILTVYAALASAGRGMVTSERATRWLKRSIGGVFLALGAAAAVYRRAA